MRYASLDDCHAAVGGMVEMVIQAAIDRHGSCTIALAGGKTPAALYGMLGCPPWATRIPWAKVRFFFGDERCVPPDHPESNFGMARKNLFAHLSIADEQVFRMPVEIRPYAAAALHYQQTMAEAFGALVGRARRYGAGEYPSFDLILLGMGMDGHTASLLPGHPALNRMDWVAEVGGEGAVPPVPRLTLTLPLLNNADTVLFLVSGTEKVRLADAVLAGPPQSRYPASLVRPRHRLLWYLVA
jgi:6-phosphogluconolactonase